MAKKDLKIDYTSSMNPELEDEAIRARLSGYKRKSARGPRDTKITLVVPSSLAQELRTIAKVTERPTNDICNKFLEEYAEENQEVIERYKRMINDPQA